MLLCIYSKEMHGFYLNFWLCCSHLAEHNLHSLPCFCFITNYTATVLYAWRCTASWYQTQKTSAKSWEESGRSWVCKMKCHKRCCCVVALDSKPMWAPSKEGVNEATWLVYYVCEVFGSHCRIAWVETAFEHIIWKTLYILNKSLPFALHYTSICRA